MLAPRRVKVVYWRDRLGVKLAPSRPHRNPAIQQRRFSSDPETTTWPRGALRDFAGSRNEGRNRPRLEGTEKTIPPSDVAVVEGVNVELMVDGVMFGALDEVA